jgi:hypothetical protein
VDKDGFQKVKVGARDKFKLELEIPTKGSQLRWDFSTDGHDIGFEVIYLKNGKSPVEWSRLDSHHSIQKGSINCGEQVGKYQLVFDNSFSFTKSKILKYSVAVVEPEELNIIQDLENVD